LAVARRLLDQNVSCSIWDQDEAALERVQSELASHEGRVHCAVTDVVSEASVRSATQQVKDAWGGIDILVNNAGIAGVSKKLWECSPQEWRQVIDIDLIGVFQCCRAVVPIMLESQFGRIINIASIAGKEGNPNASHYSAAKAGVIGLTKSLGKELAQTGVLVNCITPAVIETDILKQVSDEHRQYMISRIPMGRTGEVHEVAALVAWLASDECSFSTGAVFDISGGRATY